ncbi:MAG: aryl-sulfate sulfotransferase [Bacteroidetes bacterium]|nr:aryl-sulfate sulfotransferase [Bacteroidota bacterium]
MHSQDRTVGLQVSTKGQSGNYVLFSPLYSTETYLIDVCGKQIRTWSSQYPPGVALSLLKDGSLLRAGSVGNTKFGSGQGGIIERYNWDLSLRWSWQLSDSTQVLHHDIKPMPNGHYLAIVWEAHTRADAIANGRVTSFPNVPVWSERIIEIAPVGKDSATIVWEWRAWDHMMQDKDPAKPNYKVVKEHPELININYYPAATPRDWFHINGVDYNPVLDQIVLSVHSLNEFWIIDHSSTTAQAKGHTGGLRGKGGDLLYRWGNPATYSRGTTADQKLFGQHHVHWVPDSLKYGGKLMLFNNGYNRPGSETYSSIEVITPPLDDFGSYGRDTGAAFGPANPIIAYTAPKKSDFYSAFISGVYSLYNGNMLITEGNNGRLFEVDSTGQIVWQYQNPDAGTTLYKQGETPLSTQVFRAESYRANFAGFTGKKLIPNGEIEGQPLPTSICYKAQNNHVTEYKADLNAAWPNPANDVLYVPGQSAADLYDMQGRLVQAGLKGNVKVSHLQDGCYLLLNNTGMKTRVVIQH